MVDYLEIYETRNRIYDRINNLINEANDGNEKDTKGAIALQRLFRGFKIRNIVFHQT